MTERRLDDRERRVVLDALLEAEVGSERVCREAVEACRLIRCIPSLLEVRGMRSAVAYAALRKRAKGITLGDDVYIRSDCVGPALEIPLDLLAHEVAHVAQYRRDGASTFLRKYIWEYTRGLAEGLGDERAYLSIPYEREARRVADLVEGD